MRTETAPAKVKNVVEPTKAFEPETDEFDHISITPTSVARSREAYAARTAFAYDHSDLNDA